MHRNSEPLLGPAGPSSEASSLVLPPTPSWLPPGSPLGTPFQGLAAPGDGLSSLRPKWGLRRLVKIRLLLSACLQ